MKFITIVLRVTLAIALISAQLTWSEKEESPIPYKHLAPKSSLSHLDESGGIKLKSLFGGTRLARHSRIIVLLSICIIFIAFIFYLSPSYTPTQVNKKTAQKKSVKQAKSIYGVYGSHVTRNHFNNQKPYLEKIFKLARSQNKKVVFFHEYGGIPFSVIKHFYPRKLWGITEWDIAAANPDPNKIARYKEAYLDYLKTRFRSESTLRLLRLSSNPYESALSSFLDSNQGLIRDVTNELKAATNKDLAIIVEQHIQQMRMDTLLNQAGFLACQGEELNKVLQKAAEAGQIHSQYLRYRDQVFSRSLLRLKQQYPNDLIVFTRGSAHLISREIRRGVQDDIDEANVSQWTRSLDQYASELIFPSQSLTQQDLEDILLKTIAEIIASDVIGIQSISDEKWEKLSDGFSSLIQELNRRELMQFFSNVNRLALQSRRTGEPLYKLFLKWFFKHIPKTRKYKDLLSLRSSNSKISWDLAILDKAL